MKSIVFEFSKIIKFVKSVQVSYKLRRVYFVYIKRGSQKGGASLSESGSEMEARSNRKTLTCGFCGFLAAFLVFSFLLGRQKRREEKKRVGSFGVGA